jgi:hypothetical protein
MALDLSYIIPIFLCVFSSIISPLAKYG